MVKKLPAKQKILARAPLFGEQPNRGDAEERPPPLRYAGAEALAQALRQYKEEHPEKQPYCDLCDF